MPAAERNSPGLSAVPFLLFLTHVLLGFDELSSKHRPSSRQGGPCEGCLLLRLGTDGGA